jgi:STE24 endopeptidase
MHSPSLWTHDVGRAKRYAAEKLRASLIAAGITLAWLILSIFFARPVAAWGQQVLGIRLGGPLALAAALLAGRAVVGFPLDVYADFLHERRYGLSRYRFGGWLADWLKGAALGFALGLAAAAFAYAAIWTWPAGWVLPVAAAWLALTLLLDLLFPILILPLFISLAPLDRPDLADRLGRLAESAGFRFAGLYRAGLAAKTAKANAFLMGWGPTRRIALADTLLDRYATDEIVAVFAHELGHHARRHTARGLAIGAAGFAALLLAALAAEAWILRPMGYAGLGDPAAMPALGLSALAVHVLAAPLRNAVSRRFERESDRYALEATGDPGAFIRLMVKLAAQNLADPSPRPLVERWFYSHPSMEKRVAMARRFAPGEVEGRGGTNASRGAGV